MIYHPKHTVISILLTIIAIGTFSYAGEIPQSARPVEEVVKTGPNPFFKINSSDIVGDDSLFNFCIFADSLQRNDLLRRFEICGYSSPDGPEAFNAKLAIDRANAIRSLIQNKYEIPDFLFQINSVAEDWEETRQLVQASSMQGKQDVLNIIDNTADKTAREKRLRTLNSGQHISAHIICGLRQRMQNIKTT